MKNPFIFQNDPFGFAGRNDAADNAGQIREMQQALTRRLETELPLNGVMGFRTRRALRNFQIQNGLPVDGRATSDTLRALFRNPRAKRRTDSEFELEFETAPRPSPHKFDDCTAAQKTALLAISKNAQSALNHAAAVLGSIYGGSTRMTERVRQLLNTHFHTTDRGNILKIFRNLFRINQAFEKGLRFECETDCGTGVCGYAWATQWFGGYGDIHICFDDRPGHCGFNKLSQTAKVAVIIHEAAHRHAGIDDKAYVWEKPPLSTKDYRKLTPAQAMNNADSYANFCAELFYSR